MRLRFFIGFAVLVPAFVLFSSWTTAPEAVPTRIASDERVLFFPQAARQSVDGSSWIIPIHGWIFEPESDDTTRNALVAAMRADLELALDKNSLARFDRRIRQLLVDDERGKRVGIRLCQRRFTMPESSENGHFFRELTISSSLIEQYGKDGWLRFDVPLPADSSLAFEGRVRLRPPAGVTVISDIDDTVKISEVTNKKRLIANTFLNEFQAVEGMPNLYQAWAAKGADFTFVSSSPWQLYPDLAAWMSVEKFPPATFQLKQIRFRDSSLVKLFDDPFESKVTRVSAVLKHFPERRFILVGDSGEKDPEVYGELTRKFPKQVAVSLIRNVTDESRSSPRMQAAFHKVPDAGWQIFETPADIQLPDGIFD